jgi:uncharacterized protein YndB with AHSA1/START domain
MTVHSDQLGTFSRAADGTYAVEFVRQLQDPPERVWRALTDPAEARQWFTEMTMEPRLGGRIHLDFGDQGSAEGEILAWEPPHVLEHSWTEAGTTSHVRWELSPEGNGTRLWLLHTGLSPDAPHEYGAGWHDFLDRLPYYLAGNDIPPIWEQFESLLERYRALA